MAELDVDRLKRLRDDEDFLDDLCRPQERYSDAEFYDREFNRGLNAARIAIIERVNLSAIIAALEGRDD